MKILTPGRLLPLLAVLMLHFSCTKDFQAEQAAQELKNSATGLQGQTALAQSSCVEDQHNGSMNDSLPQPTVLGYHLVNNPYSVANMQQASINLYGNASGIVENKWYVRVKPSSPEQLAALEDLDVDLSNHPLDYEVEQEGDYYDDGVTPAEEIPWLYTVVTPNFTFPAGMQYEILQHVHVPDAPELENEAFRITGNPIDNPTCNQTSEPQFASTQKSNSPMRMPQCLEGYHWDFETRKCEPDNCPQGWHWDNTQNSCVPDAPPPPPAVRKPSGTIRVWDTNLGVYRGVRNARVVARRFLKAERTYTDNQGQFFIDKKFNRVVLLVKFKNAQSRIKAVRRARLWQILFPVEIKMGKFSGSLDNIIYNINHSNDAFSVGAKDWAAATANNAVQEYYDYASQLGVGTPPGGIKILLTNWRTQGVAGASPMFAKRLSTDLPSAFVANFILGQVSGAVGGIAAFVNVLKGQLDITMGYNMYSAYGYDQTADSDRFSELCFHELTHAAHYNKVGNSWWGDLVSAEIHEMIFSGNSPYGNGNNGATSDIIGLGESWAYHMGHFMADRKYGMSSSTAYEQGISYANNSPAYGLSSHLNLLEDFSPVRNADPFHWIPQGIYYDMIDNRNDKPFIRVDIDDQVTGYTNQQFFNSLDDDINSLPAYRQRLLNENGSNQSVQVTNLFNAYGY